MGEGQPGVRRELLYVPRHPRDGPDFVVQEEDLAAALQLAHQRIAKHPAIPFRDQGLDGHPPGGRRRDDGQIPNSRHGHVQRAGDRCRGERQQIHLGPQLLQPLLLLHAESLLLVDDDQAQLLEADVPLKQAVGPDHDVHLALLEAEQDLFQFAAAPES